VKLIGRITSKFNDDEVPFHEIISELEEKLPQLKDFLQKILKLFISHTIPDMLQQYGGLRIISYQQILVRLVIFVKYVKV
jgi:hypothetical protein